MLVKVSGSVTNCHALKMRAADGKMRFTDVADTEQLLRLIQSIPSPKAEPFKLWLAKVGYERIEETEDPELAFDRAMQTYLKKGYSKGWINQRLKSIEVRKELTDEITRAWADKSVKEYKHFKGLKKQNLRDNMTNLELPDGLHASGYALEEAGTTCARLIILWNRRVCCFRGRIQLVVRAISLAESPGRAAGSVSGICRALILMPPGTRDSRDTLHFLISTTCTGLG